MTRTIIAAVLLSLTLSVLPAAAADGASTAATMRTLNQAGFAFQMHPSPPIFRSDKLSPSAPGKSATWWSGLALSDPMKPRPPRRAPRS